MDEEDQVRRLDRDLKYDLREQTLALKVLQDEMREHVATQGQLDTTSKEAVEAFNNKLAKLNDSGTSLNKRVDELNSRTDSFNARVTAMNKRCAGLAVNSKDKEAVLKERASKAPK